MTDEIRVTVTGSNSVAREYATGIVEAAFKHGGFTDVQTLNPAAEPVIYPDVTTMFDLVSQHAPQVFNEKVRIQGSFADFEDTNAKGAFGPVPVAKFQYFDGVWDPIREGEKTVSPGNGNTIFELSISEKDYQRVLKLDEERKKTASKAKMSEKA
jgi:hypothetical protein